MSLPRTNNPTNKKEAHGDKRSEISLKPAAWLRTVTGNLTGLMRLVSNQPKPKQEREMKALTDNGIDEATIGVGALVNWQSKNYGQNADVVSYIERDADGTIVRIAFSSWLHIFTNRMKLTVFPSERPISPLWSERYNEEMTQIGRWYISMQLRGLITVN